MSLTDEIGREISAEGAISFARFMELALYHPDHGYYTRGPRRAGAEWLTGPTLHPIFGLTLARGLAPLLAQLEDPVLVEAGAGSGELLRDICYGLHQADPKTFARLELAVVDRSQANRRRARETLEQAGIDLEDVAFHEHLPAAVEGVVLSNELHDAMPVHLVQRTEDGVRELLVGEGERGFTFQHGWPSSPEVAGVGEQRLDERPPGTRTEVPLAALDWQQEAAGALRRGALVCIDYGAPSRVLLDRYPGGTVHGYHRGRRTREVLLAPGELDLTYLVPLDLVCEQGEEAGCETSLLAPQGEVLDALGIRSLVSELTGMDALAAKKLVDPAGAGGTFQVLVQARGVEVVSPWPAGTIRTGAPPALPALDAPAGS